MLRLSVKDIEEKVSISVKDTGVGIAEEVILNMYRDEVIVKQIGLYNVHQRVKLIYGEGLVINRLSLGTEVYFDIEKESR